MVASLVETREEVTEAGFPNAKYQTVWKLCFAGIERQGTHSVNLSLNPFKLLPLEIVVIRAR